MAKGRYGKMTVKEAIEKLRAVDVIIKRTDHNEFKVNFRGGKEATAYYTNDLDDAVGTGLSMARDKAGSSGKCRLCGAFGHGAFTCPLGPNG